MPPSGVPTSLVDLPAYLDRLAVDDVPPGRDPRTLQRLMAAHVASVPFENLDPLLGRPVSLDPAAVERKLVSEQRGGYCYEQNLLFSTALRTLGFAVEPLIARVLWNQPAGTVPARSHMVLLVDLGGVPHLVDVGFGTRNLTGPLPLVADDVVRQSHDTYRLLESDEGWTLQVLTAGQWWSMYRFDRQPQHPVDYEVANHWSATFPSSRFVTHLIAARTLPDARLTLYDGAFAVRRLDGSADERVLHHPNDVLTCLEADFGISLPQPDLLRQRVAALLP